MKFLPIFLVFVMCFAARGYSETLQCYECADCGDLTDSLLQSCPREATEPPATTTTEEPTTTTEDTTTTEETTTTTEPSPTTTTVAQGGQDSKLSAVNPEVLYLTNGIANAVSQNSRLSRSYRSIFRAGPSYLCYSVDKIDGDNRTQQKGCVEVPEDKQACDVLKEKYGEIDNCSTCQDSRCNSSAALKYSIVMLMMTVVLGIFFK